MTEGQTAPMRWVANTWRNMTLDLIVNEFDQTKAQALAKYHKWLEGKIIGEPMAAGRFTVKDMKDMGMVGVYELEQTQS